MTLRICDVTPAKIKMHRCIWSIGAFFRGFEKCTLILIFLVVLVTSHRQKSKFTGAFGTLEHFSEVLKMHPYFEFSWWIWRFCTKRSNHGQFCYANKFYSDDDKAVLVAFELLFCHPLFGSVRMMGVGICANGHSLD